MKNTIRFGLSVFLVAMIASSAKAYIYTCSPSEIMSLPRLLQVQMRGTQEVPESLQGFVQKFYDWYVHEALRDPAVSTWVFALKEKSSVFSPQLTRALKEDSAAQAKSSGYIVGIDFDPILNSQDPSEHYEVGKITRKDQNYCVEIYRVTSGKRSGRPDVIPELALVDGKWVFVNFHYLNLMEDYPQSGDLLSILKSLREERQKKSQW